MDFVTHAAVGAIAGRALAPRAGGGEGTLGARGGAACAALGAIAALAPDVDHLLEVVGAEAYLVHHRTLTHSLLFAAALTALAASPAGGALLSRLGIGSGLRRGAITAASLATHLALDVLTPFGTMLLWPLDARLFSLDALPIVAPFMTALSLVCAIAVRRRGREAAWLALGVLAAFLALEQTVARRAEAAARADLDDPQRSDHEEFAVLLSVPSPLDPLAADVFVRVGRGEGGDVRRLTVSGLLISPATASVDEVAARPRIKGPMFAESPATARGALVARLEAEQPIRGWLGRFRVPVATIDAGGAVVWDDLQYEAVAPKGRWPLRLRATPPSPPDPGAETYRSSVEENPRGPQLALYLGVLAAVLWLARRAGAFKSDAAPSGS